MPRTTRAHHAVWVRQLADQLERDGHPATRLLRRAGIDRHAIRADDARIPFARHAAFFEIAAEALGDDTLGIDFAATRDTRDAGLIGYVGRASPTVADALKNLARYRHVFSDAVELDVSDLDGKGRVVWAFQGVGPAESRQAIEFGAANVLTALRRGTGAAITPTSLSFVHSHHSARAAVEAALGCRVRFGASENAVTFAARDLRLPIVSADERLLAILRRYCEEVLARHPSRPPELVERIEALVTERLAKGEATLAAVAPELGMSERTLSRRLAAEGTSFKAILDALRRELALSYLRDGALSLTEIAFLLGYGEVSSFNHAFKRWTGEAPSAVRARAQ